MSNQVKQTAPVTSQQERKELIDQLCATLGSQKVLQKYRSL